MVSTYEEKLNEAEKHARSFSANFEIQVTNVKIQLEAVKTRVQQNESFVSKLQECLQIIHRNRSSRTRIDSPSSRELLILNDEVEGIRRLTMIEEDDLYEDDEEIIDESILDDFSSEVENVEEFDPSGKVEDLDDLADVEKLEIVDTSKDSVDCKEIDHTGDVTDFKQEEDINKLLEVKWMEGECRIKEDTLDLEDEVEFNEKSLDALDWKWIKEEEESSKVEVDVKDVLDEIEMKEDVLEIDWSLETCDLQDVKTDEYDDILESDEDIGMAGVDKETEIDDMDVDQVKWMNKSFDTMKESVKIEDWMVECDIKLHLSTLKEEYVTDFEDD